MNFFEVLNLYFDNYKNHNSWTRFCTCVFQNIIFTYVFMLPIKKNFEQKKIFDEKKKLESLKQKKLIEMEKKTNENVEKEENQQEKKKKLKIEDLSFLSNIFSKNFFHDEEKKKKNSILVYVFDIVVLIWCVALCITIIPYYRLPQSTLWSCFYAIFFQTIITLVLLTFKITEKLKIKIKKREKKIKIKKIVLVGKKKIGLLGKKFFLKCLEKLQIFTLGWFLWFTNGIQTW
jgi:hypothetical protein